MGACNLIIRESINSREILGLVCYKTACSSLILNLETIETHVDAQREKVSLVKSKRTSAVFETGLFLISHMNDKRFYSSAFGLTVSSLGTESGIFIYRTDALKQRRNWGLEPGLGYFFLLHVVC